MQLHERIRAFIKKHKTPLELFQWSVIGGVATLVYSSYISAIQKKTFPTKRLNVPTIHSVKEYLDHDSEIMEWMSINLIDQIMKHPLIKEFQEHPELAIISQDNAEMLKCVFDSYVIPHVNQTIPSAIARKFGIGNDDNQMVHEDRSIDLPIAKELTLDITAYLVEEIVLAWLINMPSICKQLHDPLDYKNIQLEDQDILTLDSDQAIAPIYINGAILNNDDMMKLINFVTGTHVDQLDAGTWIVSTSPYNSVNIRRLCQKDT